ncbi:hypothetical protein QD357_30720 [Rhizobium sp. BR 317]|uniref:hypothetical protein n=1 Tax=Rhizobium sp. BR 317 TaxID=3040015 RepID=UPI0039BEE97C
MFPALGLLIAIHAAEIAGFPACRVHTQQTAPSWVWSNGLDGTGVSVMTVIKFSKAWREESNPEAEFRIVDDFGQHMFRFLAEYEFDGRIFSISFWAHDITDAERRVACMRGSLNLQGQI